MSIFDKIFTYINHSSDLTPKIIEDYKNSLIFIGDEQQIYQPLTNTYVGIPKSDIENVIGSSKVSIITETNSDSSYYITFANTLGGFSYSYIDQNLNYNPYKNTLTVTYFEGNLKGNAYTANRLYGDSSYTAWGRTFWDNGIPQTIDGDLEDVGNIISKLDNSYNLGSETNRFSYTYSNSVVGNLYGTATNAINSYNSNISNISYISKIIETNDDINLFITFSYGNYSYSYIDQNLRYNPNTNTLTTTTFIGNLTGNVTGNADSANKLNGDNSYTAWGRTFWSNGVPQTIDGDLENVGNIISKLDNSYNLGSETNRFSYTYSNSVVGNLYGTATNAIDSINSEYSNSSYTSYIISTEDNVDLYITFAYNNRYSYSYLDQGLKYNPSTNTLTTTKFVGNLEGNLKGNADTASRLYGDSSYTAWGRTFWDNGIPQTIDGDITNTGKIIPKTTYVSTLGSIDKFFGYTYSKSFIGNLYGLATNAIDSINSEYSNSSYTSYIISTEDNVDLYLTFSYNNRYSYSYIDQGLKYNPSTNTLTTTNFVGNLTGNVTGNADTANRLNGNNTYTAWGRTFWSNGIPQTIDGDITNTGKIIPKTTYVSTLGSTDKFFGYTYSKSFIGNLYGLATNAIDSINSEYSNSSYTSYIISTEDNVDLYITFAYNNRYSYSYLDQGLKYNPSTNTLTTTNFVGNLTGNVTGNANTANRLNGNNTYTAWGRTFWSNGVPQTIDGDITNTGKIIPKTTYVSTLGSTDKFFGYTYSKSFIGNLYGLATNAIDSINSKYSNSSYTSYIISTEDNVDLYLTFSYNNRYSYSYIDQGLKYNPSTNTLTTTNFVGNLTGNVNGNANTASRLNSNNTYTAWGRTFWSNGVPQTIDGDITNTGKIIPKTTYVSTLGSTDKFFGYTYSKSFIGNLYGLATQAIESQKSTISNYSYTSRIISNNDDDEFYITFSYNNEYSYSYIDQGLNYNPNTNTLTTSNLVGRLEPSLQWGIIEGID